MLTNNTSRGELMDEEAVKRLEILNSQVSRLMFLGANIVRSSYQLTVDESGRDGTMFWSLLTSVDVRPMPQQTEEFLAELVAEELTL